MQRLQAPLKIAGPMAAPQPVQRVAAAGVPEHVVRSRPSALPTTAVTGCAALACPEFIYAPGGARAINRCCPAMPILMSIASALRYKTGDLQHAVADGAASS